MITSFKFLVALFPVLRHFCSRFLRHWNYRHSRSLQVSPPPPKKKKNTLRVTYGSDQLLRFICNGYVFVFFQGICCQNSQAILGSLQPVHAVCGSPGF